MNFFEGYAFYGQLYGEQDLRRGCGSIKDIFVNCGRKIASNPDRGCWRETGFRQDLTYPDLPWPPDVRIAMVVATGCRTSDFEGTSVSLHEHFSPGGRSGACVGQTRTVGMNER